MIGLGYVHDEWAGATERLVGLPSSKRDENLDLEAFIPPPRDQTTTSACVAFATMLHVWTQMHRLAVESGQAILPEYPSERWAYFLARAKARSNASTPLIDKGSKPGDLLLGVWENGLIPESLLPWDANKVNEEPTLAEAVAALSFTIGEYAFLGSGDHRLNGIVAACDEGLGAIVAIEVDSRAMLNDGPDILGKMNPGDIQGSHMVPIYGYRRTITGRLQYKIQNSWGIRYRMGGTVWLDEDLVASEQCFGAAYVKVVPSW